MIKYKTVVGRSSTKRYSGTPYQVLVQLEHVYASKVSAGPNPSMHLLHDGPFLFIERHM